MSGFQILNKEGVPITISQLDREAAEFWKKTFIQRTTLIHFLN